MARRRTLLVLAAALLASSNAGADIPMGPFDVPTAFFITSDAGDRVDYGVRLDQRCAPTKDDAVFLYWRHFDPDGKTSTHALTTFEYIPYGVSEQRTIRKTQTGGVHLMRLRQFDKVPIAIVTKVDGQRCTGQARTILDGKEVELVSLHAQVSHKGLIPSVEYVDVHAKNLETGAEITARMRKP